MSVDLVISNHTRRAVNSRWLSRQLQKLLVLKKISRGSWSISIVNDREMAALHKRTMNDESTTDVLTFDLREHAKPAKVSGKGRTRIRKSSLDLDTVLCADVAARLARELRHSLNHELLLYALHSLLHVQGYDDTTDAEFERMHRREDELLIALGIGPLFKASSAPRVTDH